MISNFICELYISWWMPANHPELASAKVVQEKAIRDVFAIHVCLHVLSRVKFPFPFFSHFSLIINFLLKTYLLSYNFLQPLLEVPITILLFFFLYIESSQSNVNLFVFLLPLNLQSIDLGTISELQKIAAGSIIENSLGYTSRSFRSKKCIFEVSLGRSWRLRINLQHIDALLSLGLKLNGSKQAPFPVPFEWMAYFILVQIKVFLFIPHSEIL